MTAQVFIPFLIPSISEYIEQVTAKTPKLKLGGVICAVGAELNKHFSMCGEFVARLEKDGWTIRCWADGCNAQHGDVFTEDQAILRLKAIGINPNHLTVSTTWDVWHPPEPVVEQTKEERYQYAATA